MALGDRATVRSFTAAESAAYHSHIGAFVLMNGVVLDWFSQMLNTPDPGQPLGDYSGRHERPIVNGIPR